MDFSGFGGFVAVARGVGEKGFAGGEKSPLAFSGLAFVEVDFAVSLES